VKDLMNDRPTQDLTILNKNNTFYTVLWTLSKKNLSAAPVYDEENKKFIGSVSSLDLVTYACLSFEEKKLISMSDREFWNKEIDMVKDDADIISNLSTRNPLVTVKKSDTMDKVMSIFANGPALHRVWVEDEKDASSIIACVTQSDVSRFLLRHFVDFQQELWGTSVEEWGMKEVKTVKTTEQAAKAFELLIDCRVSAIPIVDNSNRIISTLSATDMKGVGPGVIFKSLSKSVVEFKHEVNERENKIPREAITCRKGDRLLSVMEKMLDNSIHRVWVVDDRGSVVGVVSLTDIFSQIKKK